MKNEVDAIQHQHSIKIGFHYKNVQIQSINRNSIRIQMATDAKHIVNLNIISWEIQEISKTTQFHYNIALADM